MKKITKIIAGATIGSLALIGAVVGGCLSATYSQPTVSQKSTNQIATSSTNSNLNDNQTKRSEVDSSSTSPLSQVDHLVTKKVSNLDSSLLSNSTNSFNFTCPNGNILSLSANHDGANTLTLNGFVSKKSTDLIIPNIVIHDNSMYVITQVASGAFYDQGLTSVSFNNNLLSIGNLAFANNDLTSLSFPNNLQSIGNKAFISNAFPHAYAVYLPNNTTWSKNWLTCPFGCLDNYSQLIAGIEWVIQANAAYRFQPNQNAWVVTSYTYTSSNLNNPNWSIGPSTTSWTNNPVSNTTQKSYKTTTNVNVTVPTCANDTLSNYCLWTQLSSGGVGWVFYFNPTNHTFNIYVYTNANLVANTLFGWTVNTTLTISLYDPHTGTYDFNQTINANSQAPTGYTSVNSNQTIFSYPYHDGDILTYSMSNSSGDTAVYLASNFNPDVATNNQLPSGLNNFYQISDSWTNRDGLNELFIIKPQGIFPTFGPTNLSNVCYDPTSGKLLLVGTTLPNITFNVNINKNSVGTITSNSDGEINDTITIAKNLTASTNFTLVAKDSNNTIVPYPYTSHLEGYNPKLTVFGLSVGGLNTQFLFDGFSGKIATTDISNFWPAYASPYNNFSVGSTIGSGTISQSGTLSIALTNPSGTTKDYTFDFNTASGSTKATTITDLNNFLNNIPYQVGDTYVFGGTYPAVNFNFVYVNGQFVPYWSAYDSQTVSENTSFTVTNDGITWNDYDNGNGVENNTYLNATNQAGYYSSASDTATYPRYWEASYGQLACNPWAEFTNGWMNNWYDPNQTMVQVANQLSASYASPIDKIEATFDWVYSNMDYTDGYSYGHTIRQTFQHLQGVCGDIASLMGALLKLEGFVTRQVNGYVNYYNGLHDCTISHYGNAVYEYNHIWIQVWVPSYQEWITLDPTMDWSNIGELTSVFNVIRSNMTIIYVEWPEKATGLYYDSYGTLAYHDYEEDNYFSYFKGCEYDALYNLGRHFNIPAGLDDDIYTPDFAQALASLINWAANPSNSISSNNTYNWEQMNNI